MNPKQGLNAAETLIQVNKDAKGSFLVALPYFLYRHVLYKSERHYTTQRPYFRTSGRVFFRTLAMPHSTISIKFPITHGPFIVHRSQRMLECVVPVRFQGNVWQKSLIGRRRAVRFGLEVGAGAISQSVQDQQYEGLALSRARSMTTHVDRSFTCILFVEFLRQKGFRYRNRLREVLSLCVASFYARSRVWRVCGQVPMPRQSAPAESHRPRGNNAPLMA